MLTPSRRLFSCLLLTSVCLMAHANDAPKPLDPFEDLIDSKLLQPTSEVFFTPLHDRRVGLIIAKNAEKQLAWIRDLVQPKGANAFFVNALGLAPQMQALATKFVDPNDMKEAILLPFVLRAREVKVMPDLQAFQDSGFEVAAIVDVNYHRSISGIFVRNFEYGLKLDAHLLDKTLRRGPTITGSSLIKTSVEGFGNWEYLFRSKSVAIERFQEQAASMLGPVKQQPVPRPSPAASNLTVEQRLEQLESLLLRGLITQDEARERRKQILGEL